MHKVFNVSASAPDWRAYYRLWRKSEIISKFGYVGKNFLMNLSVFDYSVFSYILFSRLKLRFYKNYRASAMESTLINFSKDDE